MEDKSIEKIMELLVDSPKVLREIIEKVFKKELRDPGIDISRYHFEVLKVLHDSGKMSISELGDILVISKTQMTRLTSELSATGKISREPDPTDRRKSIVSLTDEGRQCISLVMDRFYKTTRERLEPLSKKELDELLVSLGKVTQFVRRLLAT